MPRDPFADDPNDPAAFIEDDEELPPLTEEERMSYLADLHMVSQFRAVLDPRGVRGIVFWCSGCEEKHYFDWDFLEASLQSAAYNGPHIAHEPGTHTDPEDYVTWDYALGFMNGLMEA